MKSIKLSPDVIAKITLLRERDKLSFGEIASLLGLKYTKVNSAYRSANGESGVRFRATPNQPPPEVIAKVSAP
jgi:DNA-directed RNA polymerase specialized sigma24 family protein